MVRDEKEISILVYATWSMGYLQRVSWIFDLAIFFSPVVTLFRPASCYKKAHLVFTYLLQSIEMANIHGRKEEKPSSSPVDTLWISGPINPDLHFTAIASIDSVCTYSYLVS